MFTGWLANMMNKPSPAVAPYVRKEDGEKEGPQASASMSTTTATNRPSASPDMSLPDATKMSDAISSSGMTNQALRNASKLPRAIDVKKAVLVSARQQAISIRSHSHYSKDRRLFSLIHEH
jgi:hypothetical protein